MVNMKRMRISSLIMTMVMLLQIFTIQVFAEKSEKNLSASDINALKKYDASLCENIQIKALKNSGKLNGFIDLLDTEFESQEEENYEEMKKMFDFWEINMNDSIDSIKQKSQKYLNENENNLVIGSKEFDEYVKRTLNDDENPIHAKAQEEKEVGALYIYMCLYNEKMDNNTEYLNKIIQVQNESDNNEITLAQIVEADFEYNFCDTQIPLLLNNYIEENEINWGVSKFPYLSAGKIQEYAREYSSTERGNTYYEHFDGGDCTNFVSQALRNGGLPFNNNSSDSSANGVVSTKSRWFYFKNSSNSGYSVSTSWIRVSELYDYLAPHYKVYEGKSNEKFNLYVNMGCVLQGKRLLGSYSHSVIVVLVGRSIRYCAHTKARKDEPIKTFYDGFNKCRAIEVYQTY